MHDVTGGGNAAELARRVLNYLHRDEQHGLSDLSFPKPQGYLPVPICALTGKLATAACDPVFEEWFKPGQEPQEEDNVHVRLAIDVRNGLIASARTPARFVEQRTFINLPPRYADWAAQAGLPHPPSEVSTLGAKEGMSVVQMRTPNINPAANTDPEVLRIVSPADGLNLFRDPTLPSARNTIAFRAEVSPSVPEVLWLLDGKPYKLAGYPYTLRWPLQAGDHVIQVSMPLSRVRSAVVHIHVQ
jgi:penicillin-binding protein 1C